MLPGNVREVGLACQDKNTDFKTNARHHTQPVGAFLRLRLSTQPVTFVVRAIASISEALPWDCSHGMFRSEWNPAHKLHDLD